MQIVPVKKSGPQFKMSKVLRKLIAVYCNPGICRGSSVRIRLIENILLENGHAWNRDLTHQALAHGSNVSKYYLTKCKNRFLFYTHRDIEGLMRTSDRISVSIVELILAVLMGELELYKRGLQNNEKNWELYEQRL